MSLLNFSPRNSLHDYFELSAIRPEIHNGDGRLGKTQWWSGGNENQNNTGNGLSYWLHISIVDIWLEVRCSHTDSLAFPVSLGQTCASSSFVSLFSEAAKKMEPLLVGKKLRRLPEDELDNTLLFCAGFLCCNLCLPCPSLRMTECFQELSLVGIVIVCVCFRHRSLVAVTVSQNTKRAGFRIQKQSISSFMIDPAQTNTRVPFCASVRHHGSDFLSLIQGQLESKESSLAGLETGQSTDSVILKLVGSLMLSSLRLSSRESLANAASNLSSVPRCSHHLELGDRFEYEEFQLNGRKHAFSASCALAADAGPVSTSFAEGDVGGQQANFGALLASSWTKHRLAVLCQAALASATAIIRPFFCTFHCKTE
nr:hypothetical protein Iba_chr09cCG9340 [Ipomoea batatas]